MQLSMQKNHKNKDTEIAVSFFLLYIIFMAGIKFYLKRIKEGRLKEFVSETLWIYSYGKRYWKQTVFYTLLGFVTTGLSLLIGLVSKDLVDIITGHETGEVVKTFCMMIGLNLGSTIISQISDYVSGFISMKVDAEVKSDVFEKILVTDWEALTNYHTGDLLTRWSLDASAISAGVLNFVPNTLIFTFKFFSALFMVIYYDWTFAVFAFLSIPVSLALSKTLMKRMVSNNQRSARMGAKMSGFNQETFSNIQTIKAFGLIRLYVDYLKNLQKEYIDMRLDFKKMSIGTSLLMTFVGMLVSYSCYGWGIYRVWSGSISYGTMTMFLTLSGTLTGAVSNLTGLVPEAISITTSAGRLMDIVEMPREDYSKEKDVTDFYERNYQKGIGITCKDISYAYKTGTEVFDKASFEVSPKEIIAVIGPSGEGKTTFLRLLLSLMPVKEGEIFFEGKEEDIPASPSARSLFSYVPQGNTMFSGTISYNLRSVNKEAKDEEIIEALKLADAWEFVSKLPLGIDSEIKERGGGFSEGQAQRLSIARALMRKAPILLLDEATSALDTETEKRVLQNIKNDTFPRTLIITTHRPAVLEICDKIYTIKDKKLVLTKK